MEDSMPDPNPDSSGLVDVDKLRKEVESQQGLSYTWTYENGRRYASTDLGNYYMPNDEPEIQRLNQQHWILTQVKGGALHKAPMPTPKDGQQLKILDVGCGSGIWCIQMAEDYPDAKIVGMDVSPIQPKNKPEHVEWVLLDMEKEWPFPDDEFDLVHLSLVHGCVSDWDAMMAKMARHLKPGGYIEHQEFSLCRQYTLDTTGAKIPQPDSIDSLPAFHRWGRLMERAASTRGRNIQLGPSLPTFQSTAGLENVTETIYHIPVGTWAADEKGRLIGASIMLNATNGMEGFTTMLFTKALGWEVQDVGPFVEAVKRDLRDDGLRKVMDFHVVYGRKGRGV